MSVEHGTSPAPPTASCAPERQTTSGADLGGHGAMQRIIEGARRARHADHDLGGVRVLRIPLTQRPLPFADVDRRHGAVMPNTLSNALSGSGSAAFHASSTARSISVLTSASMRSTASSFSRPLSFM